MTGTDEAGRTAAPARLLLATTNPHKIREIRTLMSGLPIELLTLEDCSPVEPPDETGETFEENARQKALYYARATGLPTVAEDSGLAIDALDGRPGVQSARFGGAGTDYPGKFALIYEELRRRGFTGSPARFICAVALADAGRIRLETQGTIEGRIAPAPRGANGFGYDPIFFFPPYGRTLGEASDIEKAAVSHRGQAFRELRRRLEALAGA